MQIVRAKAPLRVSFAGGGTDVSPYPEERGGAVLNCTIDKFAYATLEARPDGGGTASVESLDYNVTVNYERPADMNYNGELDLVKAALKILRPKGDGSHSSDDLKLFLHSDAPQTGSGPPPPWRSPSWGSSSTTCANRGPPTRSRSSPT